MINFRWIKMTYSDWAWSSPLRSRETGSLTSENKSLRTGFEPELPTGHVFSILARSDHLARSSQKMLTLLRFDLQDSTMLKNFNICFYHQCIDTLCYIINHNIATWPNFSFIRHDDYSTRICIQMTERKDIDMTNSEGKQRKIKCRSYKMSKIFEMSLNEYKEIRT